MHITYKGDYAIKVILDLSKHYGQEVVKIQDISKRLDIPQKFLEQILLELKKGGFLDSKRGAGGGYCLSKNPNEIKIGDIVRFVDGPIEPIACANEVYRGCSEVDKCVLREIWVKVAKSVSSVVDTITFADVLKLVKARKKHITYNI